MVDIKTIESWLWKAACSIRGSIDAPKFKDYILPLIFLKRLSDIYDDEVEKLAVEFGTNDKIDQLIAKDHSLVRFYIPKKASWENIRKLTTNIGEKLTDAARLIAKENPKLQGVIDVVDFNSTVSGQRMITDEKLSKLIEIINEHRLGLKDAEPDVLGRAYEYLLRKFAEGQGQSAGEFYTPKEIGWLMAYILDPQEGQEAYDPACGSGGLLVKCALALRQKNKKIEKPLKLYGQEINHVTFAMAKMNMIIHDIEGEIAIGDTLRNPKFLVGSALRKFDIVTANPMWNQSGYDTDFYENDQYGRFPFGFPNASSGDWGWVQHMVASLSDKGKAAIVLDSGAVSRGSGSKGTSKEKEIRKSLVEKDWIEGILLLPDNLFYNTSAAGIIIVMNKNKPLERKGKIILINASEEFEKSSESSKNIIPDFSVHKISKAYGEFKNIEDFVKVISKNEAEKNDFSLLPSAYVFKKNNYKIKSLSEIASGLKEVQKKETIIDNSIISIIKSLDE